MRPPPKSRGKLDVAIAIIRDELSFNEAPAEKQGKTRVEPESNTPPVGLQ